MNATKQTELMLFAQNNCASHFKDMTLYFMGAFGATRLDCREVVIQRNVKHAQYNDAIRVLYLEKGKRKAMSRMLTHKPYMLMVHTKDAIDVPSEFDAHAGGRITRYSTFDPRWESDWAEQSKGLQPVVLVNG